MMNVALDCRFMKQGSKQHKPSKQQACTQSLISPVFGAYISSECFYLAYGALSLSIKTLVSLAGLPTYFYSEAVSTMLNNEYYIRALVFVASFLFHLFESTL